MSSGPRHEARQPQLGAWQDQLAALRARALAPAPRGSWWRPAPVPSGESLLAEQLAIAAEASDLAARIDVERRIVRHDAEGADGGSFAAALALDRRVLDDLFATATALVQVTREAARDLSAVLNDEHERGRTQLDRILGAARDRVHRVVRPVHDRAVLDAHQVDAIDTFDALPSRDVAAERELTRDTE